MKKQRICYYCVATHLGGAEKSLLDLLRKIHSRENSPTIRVLLPQASGPLVDELKKISVSYDVIPMPQSMLLVSREVPLKSAFFFIISLVKLPTYLLALRKYFARNADVIHTTGIKCHLLVWPATVGQSIQIVWHLRDILRGSTRWLLRIFSFFGGGRLKVISNSQATGKSLSSRVVTIYNGLDMDEYQAKASPQPSSKIVIGIVGVLARWKGQLEFLQMAKKLSDQGVEAEFWVVGDQIYDTIGDEGYVAELKKFTEQNHLSDKVKFLGFKKNIREIFSAMDILVHASTRAEPFGRVIVEAQASGVAVVASGAGGVLEIIRNGWNGLLFEPGDQSHMTNQVLRLIRDADLRKTLAVNARDRVNLDFNLDLHVEKILGVYAEMKHD